MYNKLVEKYYAKLAKEGWLNALLYALIGGCAAMLICSTVFWLTDFKYPWIAFIAFGVVTAALTVLLYFKKFRPSRKQIAERVDALGLEERVLTMLELENDESYIAQRQREDAKDAIGKISEKFMKIAVSTPAVITASSIALGGVAMAIVSFLSFGGKISSGKDIITEAMEPDPVYYEVEFVENGSGFLDGEIFQLVEAGKPLTEVVAIPDEEWYLYCWSYEIDGEEIILEGTDVFFVEDLLVNQNMTITAFFNELSSDQQQGQGEGEEGEGEEQEGEQDEAEADEGEEGEQNEQEPSDDPSDQPGGDKGGGKANPNHSVLDGKTDYGDSIYEGAVEEAMGDIGSNNDISDDYKDIIGDYFDNINKG